MKPIPVYRAAHMLPYLAFLRAAGAPVERHLRQARLPMLLADDPEAKLPLMPTLEFLSRITRDEGIDGLGLRARKHIKLTELSPAFIRKAQASPILRTALKTVCRLAPLEDTQLLIWIDDSASGVKVCHRHDIPLNMEHIRICELNANLWLTSIVRSFAGTGWHPNEMGFESTLALDRIICQQFPNTRMLTGQKSSWIELPCSMLSLQAHSIGRPLVTTSTGLDQDGRVELPADFADSLKQTLRAYLVDGYPDIKLAAELAGTSVRTLQRGLAQSNLIYSKLIQETRFEAALQLLSDPDMKIIDVAYATGYEDPSNFARAFRRLAGVSPHEFRMQQAA